MEDQTILIGAHTSAQGGAFNALLQGKEIGATVIQLFTSNQKRWQGKPISEEFEKKWEVALEETGISHVMSHDSYLINLGSPKEEGLTKSRQAFQEELARCHQLKLSYLNFHPGAALKEPIEQCLNLIVESLLTFEKLASEGPTRLLLETTAGQGSTIGWKFEELQYIIDRVKDKLPIGVCLDTCHSFCAGYDIRTPDTFDATLKEFDRTIGLEHLYAFHLNDSMRPFASRKDRHAPLGEGEIGIQAFQLLMQDPRTKHLPKYLETPGGPPRWKEEIKMLKEFATS